MKPCVIGSPCEFSIYRERDLKKDPAYAGSELSILLKHKPKLNAE